MYSVWIVEWKDYDFDGNEVSFERWFSHYHIAKDFARGKKDAVITEKDVS